MSEGQKEPTKPSHWFTLDRGADQATRRRQVWGLLGWYHENVVKPNQGIAGVFRRLWWRITGQRKKLLSPWEAVDAAIKQAEDVKAAAAAPAELPRGGPSQ